jgi:hypothetical protein
LAKALAAFVLALAGCGAIVAMRGLAIIERPGRLPGTL